MMYYRNTKELAHSIILLMLLSGCSTTFEISSSEIFEYDARAKAWEIVMCDSGCVPFHTTNGVFFSFKSDELINDFIDYRPHSQSYTLKIDEVEYSAYGLSCLYGNYFIDLVPTRNILESMSECELGFYIEIDDYQSKEQATIEVTYEWTKLGSRPKNFKLNLNASALEDKEENYLWVVDEQKGYRQ